MAFEFGFYNSINGDRKYNANHFGQIFDGVINDGVFAGIGDKLFVTPNGGMGILVGTGKAWFNHTWNLNTTKIPLTLSSSHVVLARYDAVVLEVNETQDAYGRENSIKVIEGAAAANPQWPALVNTDYIHQYPLAYVQVPAGATEIIAANIDIKVGTPPCPFVTGILQTVDISGLFANWNSQFDVWFSNLQAQLTDNVVTNLQNQINNCLKRTDLATDADINAGTAGKVVQASQFNIGVDKNVYKVGDIISRQYVEGLPWPPGVWLPCNGGFYNSNIYPVLYQRLANSDYARLFYGCKDTAYYSTGLALTNKNNTYNHPVLNSVNQRPVVGYRGIMFHLDYITGSSGSQSTHRHVYFAGENGILYDFSNASTYWLNVGRPIESVVSPGDWDLFYTITLSRDSLRLACVSSYSMVVEGYTPNVVENVYSLSGVSNLSVCFYAAGGFLIDNQPNGVVWDYVVYEVSGGIQKINTAYLVHLRIINRNGWSVPAVLERISCANYMWPGWSFANMLGCKQYSERHIVTVILNYDYNFNNKQIVVNAGATISIGAVLLVNSTDPSNIIGSKEIRLINNTGVALQLAVEYRGISSNLGNVQNQNIIMFGEHDGILGLDIRCITAGYSPYMCRIINLTHFENSFGVPYDLVFTPGRVNYGPSLIAPPNSASSLRVTQVTKMYERYYLVTDTTDRGGNYGTWIDGYTDLDNMDNTHIDQLRTGYVSMCNGMDPYNFEWIKGWHPVPYRLRDRGDHEVLFIFGVLKTPDAVAVAVLLKGYQYFSLPNINNDLQTSIMSGYIYKHIKAAD